MYAQLLLHFQADPFETLHTLLGWSEDMHIVFFRILKLFFITFYCIFNLDLLGICFFFFLSYEITVYCFSSCLIVFSPYTTEEHGEYVPVAGHGAWLAVLLMLFLTHFQLVNGSFMKKRTPTKTNDIDENNLLVTRPTVFPQYLLNHIRLLFCGISDTSNNFFFKGILPLYVCSIFTGFLQTKRSFCTSTSFFKNCKNQGQSFCCPQGFPGRLRALRGDYFVLVAL